MKNITLIICLLSICNYIAAQQEGIYTQSVRGIVFEKDSKEPLPGANILLNSGEKELGTVSNTQGEFVFEQVPVGRCDIRISMIGFTAYVSTNILVYSGKETMLEIALEENIQRLDEVVVTPKVDREQPLNKQAIVSARMLGSEEANRYAGSWGDVARMVSNLAGVASANDTKNDIVIRGNSPLGLLWRIDGFEILNPNHFGETGTTGGRIGILNNNQLANSDFYTGAFPAEFGNVTSGIFDLRLRNGNNKKHEFLASTGFNGFELGAEGPLSEKTGASYMINGRYSFLEILNAMGIPMNSVPEYQDISAKVNLPFRKSSLSFIALAGFSSIDYDSDMDDESEWEPGDRNTEGKMKNKQVFAGVNYTFRFNSATRLENRLSYQYFGQEVNQNQVSFPDMDIFPDLNKTATEERLSYKTEISHRANRKNYLKSGIGADMLITNLHTVYKNDLLNDYRGNSGLLHAYFQWQHRFHEAFSMTSGIYGQYYTLNSDCSVEPRVGFKWQISPVTSLVLGGGLYSQLQPHQVYFFEKDGLLVNKDLEMTRSWQAVLGYNRKIGSKIHLKTEIYYQYLFNIPVIPDIPEESILNFGDEVFNSWDYVFTNEGTGKNYGIELTVEKFFDHNYYFMITASLYDSRYKGYDGSERHTKFAGNYSFNALYGYEWKIRKYYLLSVNTKISYMGGKRFVPVSVAQEGGDKIYDYTQAYTKHLPAYFRLDLNINFKSNFRHCSLEWFFEVANITNHKNVWTKHYNSSRHKQMYVYQYGLTPMGGVRIYF